MPLNKAARSLVNPIAVPIKRETMTVQSYGILREVYKDDWMKTFHKAQGLSLNTLSR